MIAIGDGYNDLSMIKIMIVFLIGIMLLPVRNMLIMWGNMYRSGGALLR